SVHPSGTHDLTFYLHIQRPATSTLFPYTTLFRSHLETCQFSYPVYPCHVAEKGLVERLAVTPVMDNRPRRRFAQKAGAPGAFSILVTHNCRGKYTGWRDWQDTCLCGGIKNLGGTRL